jgi:hypothetical protein
MDPDGTSLQYDPETLKTNNPDHEAAEESLVCDDRGELTPAQQVERKLVSLLRSAPLPVSQLQSARPRRPLM